jgi:hypothetical protein
MPGYYLGLLKAVNVTWLIKLPGLASGVLSALSNIPGVIIAGKPVKTPG